MTSCALADLKKVLTPHVLLGKSRVETLCLLVLGMISARTVNLTHIAAERPARAIVASTYCRLQRFFQQVILPEDWSVGTVMALTGNPDRWIWQYVHQTWLANRVFDSYDAILDAGCQAWNNLIARPGRHHVNRNERLGKSGSMIGALGIMWQPQR